MPTSLAELRIPDGLEMSVTFTSIMVHLDLWHANNACLRVACDLATRYDAKLIGVAAASLQPIYSDDGSASAKLIEWQRSDITKRMAELEERFRYAAKKAGMDFEWRSALVKTAEYVSCESRSADLIVTGINYSEALIGSPLRLDLGDLVMRAGRPVLIVPPEVENLKLDCALIAWKDTREARRAAHDALPLLRKTQQAVVVEVIADEINRSASHSRIDDVVAWLGRHKISAESRVFHFADGKEPLEMLWQYGADYIVAGAYGHARLREWIFGGFTESLLKRPRRCVFLSH
jgi:nucleotide-binding universal stress UspA family protein